jgi:hypothetical protein
MKEFKGTNGVLIKIMPAPFKDAFRLKNAVVKELAKTGLNIGDISLKTELSTDVLDGFLKPIFQIDSSDEFNDAIMACMERCTYNGLKIDKDTFEPDEAREDYYIVLFEVIKANLYPFFKGVVSKLPQLTAKTPETKAATRK